jgi:iron only hydrogenase large subunit-like protein
MFTSCSPGWIKFVETFYPEMMPHLSTCKSPQGMLGAVIKSCYAEKIGIEPKKIYSVSIMPCTAKKFEASRPELGRDGYQDIDAVLTTREAAQLFKMFGIDLAKLEPEGADSPFGERSTAGKLFGASGGVMEAAVRTAYKLISGEDLKELKIEALRGLEGWGKEAHLDINGLKVGVAVVNSLANARKIIELIKKGELKDIQFVEVMSCPGGCINGGGQPYGATAERVTARMQKLYNLDATESLRLSHENKELRRLYDEYLGKPNSEKAHHLLHTHYNQRNPLT